VRDRAEHNEQQHPQRTFGWSTLHKTSRRQEQTGHETGIPGLLLPGKTEEVKLPACISHRSAALLSSGLPAIHAFELFQHVSMRKVAAARRAARRTRPAR
jgi:hypothetical protein